MFGWLGSGHMYGTVQPILRNPDTGRASRLLINIAEVAPYCKADVWRGVGKDVNWRQIFYVD